MSLHCFRITFASVTKYLQLNRTLFEIKLFFETTFTLIVVSCINRRELGVLPTFFPAQKNQYVHYRDET